MSQYTKEKILSPYSSADGLYPLTSLDIEEAAYDQINSDEDLVPLIEAELIEEAIKWFATEILPQELTPDTIVCYNLQGAEHFFTRLQAHNPDLQGYPIRVSRSLGHMQFGEIDWEKFSWFPNDVNIQGKRILIVEDINDEGLTLQTVEKLALQNGAAETKSVVLFEKLIGEIEGSIPDYALLQVAAEFLVGRGLDEGTNRFRELLKIYTLLKVPALGIESEYDDALADEELQAA